MRPGLRRQPEFMSDKPSALILQGGWPGHFPEIVAEMFAAQLRAHGFSVDIATDLAVLEDPANLLGRQVIIPNWTMGSLSSDQSANLRAAVEAGTGLAGCHGGMGDAFRGDIDYEWMVGGHFVGHPHVGNYTVRVLEQNHPATVDLPASFDYESEQYYMMVDPAIEVLAEAVYHHGGLAVEMPVIWTKAHGKGRVFYSALGHHPDEFTRYPPVLKMTIDGIRWAAGQL